MMWWDHGGWGAGEWVAMSLMMVVFWGGLIVLVSWLIRAGRSDQSQPPVSTPDQLLAERFARGDIDEEEFTRRRELLHGSSSRTH